MKVIDKLKQAIFKFCSSCLESTYDLGNKHKPLTQEEADALYEFIDSYTDDDLGE